MNKIFSIEKGFIAYLQTIFIGILTSLLIVQSLDSFSATSINIISLVVLVSQLSLIIYYFISCRKYKQNKIKDEINNKINLLNKGIMIIIISHFIAFLLAPLSFLDWQKVILYNGVEINFFVTGVAGILFLLLPLSYFLLISYKKEVNRLANQDNSYEITLFNFFTYLTKWQKILYITIIASFIAMLIITMSIDINKGNQYLSIAPYLMLNYFIMSSIIFYYIAKGVTKIYSAVLELITLIIYSVVFCILISTNVSEINRIFYFTVPFIALFVFLSRNYSNIAGKKFFASKESAFFTTISLFSLVIFQKWQTEFNFYFFLVCGLYIFLIEWILVNAIYYYPAGGIIEDSEVFTGYTILLLGFTLPCWMLKDSQEVVWLLSALLIFYPLNKLFKKELPTEY